MKRLKKIRKEIIKEEAVFSPISSSNQQRFATLAMDKPLFDAMVDVNNVVITNSVVTVSEEYVDLSSISHY
jgi:hypothetical protein